MDASAEHRERLDLLPGSLEQAVVRAMAMRPEDRFASPMEFSDAIDGPPTEQRRYGGRGTNENLHRAAEIQAAQPTSTLMSLGGVPEIAAEVGIPPEHVG